jgi:hypothetical protein
MPKRNMKHWPWRRRWKNNKDKKVWFDAFKSHFIPKWDSELLLGVWEGPTSAFSCGYMKIYNLNLKGSSGPKYIFLFFEL